MDSPLRFKWLMQNRNYKVNSIVHNFKKSVFGEKNHQNDIHWFVYYKINHTPPTCYVCTILPQEFQGTWVVMFHWLGDINHIHPSIMIPENKYTVLEIHIISNRVNRPRALSGSLHYCMFVIHHGNTEKIIHSTVKKKISASLRVLKYWKSGPWVIIA